MRLSGCFFAASYHCNNPPCHALPYPALPCPTLPCPALPCPALLDKAEDILLATAEALKLAAEET